MTKEVKIKSLGSGRGILFGLATALWQLRIVFQGGSISHGGEAMLHGANRVENQGLALITYKGWPFVVFIIHFSSLSNPRLSLPVLKTKIP